MGFSKHERKVNGRYGAHGIIKCSKCGAVIQLGDFFYSRVTKRHTKNSVAHLCEKCYEKEFIAV